MNGNEREDHKKELFVENASSAYPDSVHEFYQAIGPVEASIHNQSASKTVVLKFSQFLKSCYFVTKSRLEPRICI